MVKVGGVKVMGKARRETKKEKEELGFRVLIGVIQLLLQIMLTNMLITYQEYVLVQVGGVKVTGKGCRETKKEEGKLGSRVLI